MPLLPEEPQIHESAQGPRATPATGRPAPTPRPVPGPRSTASPRPGSPGPARPVPPVRRNASAEPPAVSPENRSEPQIQLIPAPPEGALDAADETVDLLLDTGRAPGDVLVLTATGLHPLAAHELSFGEAAYWAQQDAAEDVFYAESAALDRVANRAVVVVALNGGTEADAARILPAALTKATALLIVCGDPQRVNAALGVSV
ncbi:hypothetical protein AB0G74_09915 [Streptomyces sp. NPDC020875]|uniref:hypothetical protein n=1 Tax=Streptomyces sp. NPDC020875 TaxID=3154898 RepID=UPI0033EA4DF7